MLFEGAVLQEPHPGGRLLSLVPGLEPPVGFCFARPSTQSKPDSHADLLVEDVQRRRCVHFHVEIIR
jgi:hypothetical protein